MCCNMDLHIVFVHSGGLDVRRRMSDAGCPSRMSIADIIIIIFIFKNFYNKQYIQYNIFVIHISLEV